MTRMRVIYEPRGRAGEYAPLAANLYRGCEHGCRYCYSPRVLRMAEAEFRRAEPRRGVLAGLERDAALLGVAMDRRPVQLCFTCDPYTPADDHYGLARSAIAILKAHGLRVQILTKGGTRAARDFDLLGPEDAFGCTLTFVTERLSADWEPDAAPPDDRLEALQRAHAAGIRTWASIEPVIDPVESLAMVRRAAKFVDEFKLGAWNYHPAADAIDWPDYYRRVIDMLTGMNKRYMVKDDLRERAGV